MRISRLELESKPVAAAQLLAVWLSVNAVAELTVRAL